MATQATTTRYEAFIEKSPVKLFPALPEDNFITKCGKVFFHAIPVATALVYYAISATTSYSSQKAKVASNTLNERVWIPLKTTASQALEIANDRAWVPLKAKVSAALATATGCFTRQSSK